MTRERLYIDAIQQVMQNSSKVMVDVEGGNNMMYLPLDQLRQGGATGTDSVSDRLQNIEESIRELQRAAGSSQRLR